MNSLESAFRMFHEHPFYHTITLPERHRINQLIKQVFNARPKPAHVGQIQVYRHASESLAGKNFTVITYTNQPFSIALEDTRISRWNLESGDASKLIRYDKNTDVVVVVETDPNCVKAISIDHDREDAVISYLRWDSGDPHPSIIREIHSKVYEKLLLFTVRLTWDEIANELEAAQRIERAFVNQTDWVITKISDLSGQFYFSALDLSANPQYAHLKMHLFYVYYEVVNENRNSVCKMNCCRDRQLLA